MCGLQTMTDITEAASLFTPMAQCSAAASPLLGRLRLSHRRAEMREQKPSLLLSTGATRGQASVGGVYPLQHQLRLSPCLSRPTHTPASYQG